MRGMMALGVTGLLLVAGTLTSAQAQDRLGSGSGFVFDPRGYILTVVSDGVAHYNTARQNYLA